MLRALGANNSWVIKICGECNASASTRCDSAFAKLADSYRLLAYEPFVRKGVITTLAGNHIAGRFKLRITRRPRESVEWLWGVSSADGSQFPRDSVSHVTFSFTEDTFNSVEAIQAISYKIALGGLFLVLSRYHKPVASALFEGAHLFNLRRHVARHALVNIGGPAGRIDLRALPAAEAADWLGISGAVDARREHRLTVGSMGNSLFVRFAVYSELIAEVTVTPDGSFSIPEPLTVRQELPNLLPTASQNVGNLILGRPSPTLCFVVNDVGQTLVHPHPSMLAAALSG